MTVSNLNSLIVFTLYLVSCYRAAYGAATNATALTQCNPEQEWDCDNGECISSFSLCDGYVHCKDGSDETAENCIHFLCPAYAFRCAYGGCVAGTYRCDSRRDCADNSDETEFLCSDNNSVEVNRKLQGNCSLPTLFQCSSGECIERDQSCDGIIHCRDGSDETVRLCSYIYCPEYAFRCGYGGCIRGNAKCDGVNDCYDGSDEVAQLCGRERNRHRVPATLTPGLTTNISTVGSSTTVKPVVTESLEGCLLPLNREKLNVIDVVSGKVLRLGARVPIIAAVKFSCTPPWKLEGMDGNMCTKTDSWLYDVPYCQKDLNAKTTTVKPAVTEPLDGCQLPLSRNKLIAIDELSVEVVPLGARVPVFSALKFSCPQPWQLEGMAENLCIKTDSWLYDVPYCQKYCPQITLTQGISTLATCFHNKLAVNCSDRMEAGTTASISCAAGYRLPTRYRLQKVLTCDGDLEWDFPKFKCNPECGLMPKESAANSRPWDVSIYKRTFDPIFQRKCAGTILSPKMVVSAASCFPDPIDETDALYYNVVPGHYANDYKQGSLNRQLHNISEILLSSSQQDADMHTSHLAILVLLDYFQLSPNLAPICLEFQLKPKGELQTYVAAPDKFFRVPADIGTGTELQNREGVTFLFSVVSTKFSNGTVVLLNANFFKRFIKTQLKRYSHLL